MFIKRSVATKQSSAALRVDAIGRGFVDRRVATLLAMTTQALPAIPR
jgi:hypothetical protein